MLFQIIFDLKRSVDLRLFLITGALFISDEQMILFLTLSLLRKHSQNLQHLRTICQQTEFSREMRLQDYFPNNLQQSLLSHAESAALATQENHDEKKRLEFFFFSATQAFGRPGQYDQGQTTTFQKKSVILFELFTKINTNHASYPHTQKMSL